MFKKLVIVGLVAAVGFGCAGRPYGARDQANDQASAREENQSVEASEVDITPATQAKGTRADVELTRKIRQRIVDEEDLSMSAQNVKIITLKGVTTLRGQVKTMSEKTKVEKLARSAGAKSIKNELEIATQKE